MPKSVSRRYTRTVQARKKWASNINVFTNATPANPAQFISVVLVENKVQATDPTPTIIKCGNFKLDISPVMNIPSANYAGFISFTACVFFMPEGITETLQTLDQVTLYLKRHPEYIMSMRTCPSDTNTIQGQGGYKVWPGDPIRINTLRHD